MENNENNVNKESSNDRYYDQTSEMKLFRKGKKAVIVDDDDYSALENTREFRTALSNNGAQIIRFNPKPEKGLTMDQVEERKKDGLVNIPKHRYNKSYFSIVVKNIFTVFNILLYAIAIVIACVIDDVSQIMNLFFVLIVTSNLIIGIYQECRAKHIVGKLSLVNQAKTKVLRNSITTEIDSDELVLDDIILLSAGNKVPSDAIIKEGSVEVNESLLTGEALPVKKEIDSPLFAGSFISSGSCIAKVERIGSDNYITQLQEKAKKVKSNNSQILSSLNWIIRCITCLIIPFAFINFFVRWSSANFVNDSVIIKKIILNTCGSMVAMIPSGLYLLTSVTLFVSVIALAKRKALVNNTYSIETLARIDTLCLDKTGTITDGDMIVEKVIQINESKVDSRIVVGDLFGSFKEKNDTAKALLKKFPATGTLTAKKILPFSSSRKLTAVTFQEVGTYVIGAPEYIVPVDGPICKKLNEYTQQGFRVVLLAYSDREIVGDDIPTNLIPINAYIIKDHIRDEAYDTIKWFKDNDVHVKIISGDNPITVSKIAEEVGVENADKYISLEGMKLDEVARVANEYTVFGRVAPEQKATLVQAMQQEGHTVAMTGDGVNDILALKKADCSIAMASGSEAARNVANLVLADSNFSSMPKIVKEGRRVINNVQDLASLFLMKTLFAMILTFTTLYIFIPVNLQIIEFCVIGIPSVLLALEPNPKRIKGGFISNVLSKSLPAAFSMILATILSICICLFGLFGAPTIPFANIVLDPETSAIYSTDFLVTLAGISVSYIGLFVLGHRCLPIKTDISKPTDDKPVYTYRTAVNILRVSMFVIMVLIASIFMFVNIKIGTNPRNFFTGFAVETLADAKYASGKGWLILLGITILSCALYEVLEIVRKKKFSK